MILPLQLKSNQSRAYVPWPPSLSVSHTLGHYPPALINPGPGTIQVGTAPIPQSLQKLLKLANTVGNQQGQSGGRKEGNKGKNIYCGICGKEKVRQGTQF